MFGRVLAEQPFLLLVSWLALRLLSYRLVSLSEQDHQSQAAIRYGRSLRYGEYQSPEAFIECSAVTGLILGLFYALACLPEAPFWREFVAGMVLIPYTINIFIHYSSFYEFRILARRPLREAIELELSHREVFELSGRFFQGLALWQLVLFALTSQTILLGGAAGTYLMASLMMKDRVIESDSGQIHGEGKPLDN